MKDLFDSLYICRGFIYEALFLISMLTAIVCLLINLFVKSENTKKARKISAFVCLIIFVFTLTAPFFDTLVNGNLTHNIRISEKTILEIKEEFDKDKIEVLNKLNHGSDDNGHVKINFYSNMQIYVYEYANSDIASNVSKVEGDCDRESMGIQIVYEENDFAFGYSGIKYSPTFLLFPVEPAYYYNYTFILYDNIVIKIYQDEFRKSQIKLEENLIDLFQLV